MLAVFKELSLREQIYLLGARKASPDELNEWAAWLLSILPARIAFAETQLAIPTQSLGFYAFWQKALTEYREAVKICEETRLSHDSRRFVEREVE